MTIFLTGASGLLGGAVARAAARRGHRVVGVVHTNDQKVADCHEIRRLDLADADALVASVLQVFPDVIIHCAAVSESRLCESDPVGSQTLNVKTPETLAKLAHHLSATILHVSSEQVFRGDQAPYDRLAATAPLNLYGRQKAESERLVLACAPEFGIVLRAPLLNGNSLKGTRSLHEQLFAQWASGRVPELYTDEFRKPCSAENLAEVMVELCERRDLRGLYNWSGSDRLSRHEMGLRIRSRFRLGETAAPIKAVSRAEDAKSARRGADLALDAKPLDGLLKTRPESFDEQLEHLIVPPPARPWFTALSKT